MVYHKVDKHQIRPNQHSKINISTYLIHFINKTIKNCWVLGTILSDKYKSFTDPKESLNIVVVSHYIQTQIPNCLGVAGPGWVYSTWDVYMKISFAEL